MTNNQYALVVYPIWKAEEIGEKFASESEGEIKQIFEYLTDKCTNMYEVVNGAFEINDVNFAIKKKIEAIEIVNSVYSVSEKSSEEHEEIFDKVGTIAELLDEAYERFAVFC